MALYINLNRIYHGFSSLRTRKWANGSSYPACIAMPVGVAFDLFLSFVLKVFLEMHMCVCVCVCVCL